MHQGLARGERSWVALVQARAQALGDKEAFVFLEDGETPTPAWTFAAIEREARAYADGLRAHASPGDRVLLVLGPGPDFLVAFLACMFAGLIPVPAVPPEPRRLEKSQERLRAIIADCAPKIAVGHAVYAPALAPLLSELHVAWHAWDTLRGDPRFAPVEARPADVAFLQYTSGSTRTPRGVIVTHENLLENSAYIQQMHGSSKESVGVCWLPNYHDMGLIWGLLHPLYAGYRCYIMAPTAFLEQPRRWLQAISRFSGTYAGGPNFGFELCTRRVSRDVAETLDLSSWTCAFNGAEPIRADTLERFIAAFAPRGFRRRTFFPVYGLAEATLMVSSGGPADEPVMIDVDPRALDQGRVELAAGKRLVGCGRVGGGLDLRIVDPEAQTPCAPDRVGEIWIRGPSIAAGYFGAEAATREIFAARTASGEGPFLRTGDLGFLRAGELFITGRLKDLVIVRGENHYPQDIEWTVEGAHPLVRAGCVVAVALERKGEEVLGVAVELKTRAPESDSEVITAIRSRVSAAHGLDAEIVLLDAGAIPKTSSGKLQRQATKALFPVPIAPPAKTPSAPATLLPWQRAARAFVLERLAELCGRAPDLAAAPSALGLDSLQVLTLKGELEDAFAKRFDIAALIGAASLDAGILALLHASEARDGAVPANDHASDAETGAWLWQALHPSSDALEIFVEVDAPLDRDRLRAALRVLQTRHEILRASFAIEGGVLRRRLEEAPDLFADNLDLAARPPIAIAFDGTKTRFRFHHIGFDLEAIGVLFAELEALYRDPKTALPCAPQPSAWTAQQACRAIDRRAIAASFVQPARSIVLPQVLDGALISVRAERGEDTLRALAQRHGVTYTALVLAGIARAIAEHGNDDGFWLGVSMLGRPPSFAGCVASFANVAPVYVPPRARAMAFAELTRHVADGLLAAIDRSDVALHRVSDLMPAWMRPAPFAVIVHVRHLPSALGGGWTRALLREKPEQARVFDQSARVHAWLGADLQAELEIDISTAGDGRIGFFARGRSPGVAAAIQERALAWIDGEGGAWPAERLAHVSGPPLERSRSLLDGVFARGESPALVEPGRSLSRDDVACRSGAWAAWLRDHGVSAGDTVAFYCDPSIEVALLLLGVLRLGGSALMLDIAAPMERTERTLATAKLCVRWTSQSMRYPVTSSVPVVHLDEVAPGLTLGEVEAPPAIAAETVALRYVLPGPLALTLTHGDLVDHALAFAPHQSAQPALTTPVGQPAWATDLLASAYAGCTVYVAPVDDLGCPGWLAQHMRENAATAMRATSFRLRLFLNDLVLPGEKLPDVTHWIVEGGPRTAETAQRIAQFLPADRVFSAYAPAALGRPITFAALPSSLSSAGAPLAGVTIAIHGAAGEVLPRGVAGRIVANGVATGDHGFIDARGELHLVDAPPDAPIVLVRGERVVIAEVEAALRAVDGVRDARVIAAKDGRGDVQLVGYVEGELKAANVRAAIRKRLRDAEQPLAIECLAKLPLRADGAIDRENAPLPSWVAGVARAGPPPSTPQELAVAAIFERILTARVLTVNDDFFMLGGDSMLALKLLDALEQAGVKTSLAELRTSATVAALAARFPNAASP
ncbi:MAG: AMP-binding protein [Deltaproteobacteria bacterium]|nr:AMP-binding protein [Deltaproteobacteria bacterium]